MLIHGDYSDIMSVLVESHSKKLTTQGTASNRASCEPHTTPPSTRGSCRASYEGDTSSPDSEASFFNFSSPVSRRMTNTVRSSNRGAILAVGEELRQLLHSEQPQIIKDRRYHLRTFEKSFIGHEMVDWLLKKGEVESRREAVAMMQKLLENGVIHHGVCVCGLLVCVLVCMRTCVHVCIMSLCVFVHCCVALAWRKRKWHHCRLSTPGTHPASTDHWLLPD